MRLPFDLNKFCRRGKMAEQKNGQTKSKSGIREKLRFLNSKKVAPYVFVSPFILSFLVLTLYPTIQAFIMSFQTILPGQSRFIGFNNYQRAFNDPVFYRALSNTPIYMVLPVVILVILSIFLAVLLDSKFAIFKNFFRAGLFMPSLVSVVVAGIIFRLIFAESPLAVANQIIGFFGFEYRKSVM